MIRNVIYLPGIGDHRANIQIKLLKIFRLFGLKVHFVRIGWASDEPYEQKLKRTLEKIDSFDSPVALIGVSAGASMAITAYTARRDKIAKTVLICGKIRGASSVGDSYYRRNPAFKKSLEQSEKNLISLKAADNKKVLTLRSWRDNVVPTPDSTLEGASNRVMLSFGHIAGCAAGITIYSPYVSWFIKRR